MDTSETYVKMCDCSEIQNRANILTGDFFAIWRQNRGVFYVRVYLGNGDYGGYKSHQEKLDKVWLPRQDQIQEMMGITDGYYFYHSFVNKVFTNETYSYYRNKSPEQIWLAFYMHEKHGKVWGSKEWVKK